MSQSRTMSLLESATNSVVAFAISLVAQCVMMPLFGIETTFAQNLGIVSAFTVISITRSYLLRRLFNGFQSGRAKPDPQDDWPIGI